MADVKTTYATKELAQLLGVTERSAQRRARREAWLSRPRAGRGGGHEWLLESMPEATRLAVAAAIAARIAAARPVPARIAPEVFTVNTLAAVPEKKRERASARALLVGMALEFGAASGSSRTVAYEVFCHEYNRGAIEVPGWVRDHVPTVCRASLRNWESALGKDGLAALAGKQGMHRKGTGVIDATKGMAEVVIAHIIEYRDVSADYVLRALKTNFRGQHLPNLRSLQRWMKRYRADNEPTILNIQNPDGWRSKYQSAAGSRSAGITGANVLWELDSSPADILLADGKRYMVIGCLDVGTRRARLELAETSNSLAVCALLRRSILDFGIAETVKTDNGADYASFQVTTVLHDLGIRHELCTPFSPEEKPHIERFFGTFQSSLTTLRGFIGHSVAERKAIESRRSFADRIRRKKGEKPVLELRYSPEEFQRYCDIFCTDIYGEKRHSALGVSPNEAAARDTSPVRRVTDERALDLLLMPIAGQGGVRHIGKKGIRVDKGTYNAPELGGLDGQDVLTRKDRRNIGYIYVFDLNGIFICRAADPNLLGASERDLALARKRFQRAVVAEKAKETRKMVADVKPQELVEQIVAAEQEQAAANRAGRALRFGAEPSKEYATPALEQAALAARAASGAVPASALSEEKRQEAQNLAREALREAEEWKIPATDGRKYAECCRLAALELAGEAMPFAALNWMRAWRNSRAFKTFESVRLAGEAAKAAPNKPITAQEL